MPAPDFLQFRCAHTGMPHCLECDKDFIIPVNSIEGIYGDGGMAVVLLKGGHVSLNPGCPVPAMAQRFIRTSIPFVELVNRLDGRLENCGEIDLVQLDYLK